MKKLYVLLFRTKSKEINIYQKCINFRSNFTFGLPPSETKINQIRFDYVELDLCLTEISG